MQGRGIYYPRPDQRKFAADIPQAGISNCKLPMTKVEGSMICDIHHGSYDICYTPHADYVSCSALVCIFEFSVDKDSVIVHCCCCFLTGKG